MSAEPYEGNEVYYWAGIGILQKAEIPRQDEFGLRLDWLDSHWHVRDGKMNYCWGLGQCRAMRTSH